MGSLVLYRVVWCFAGSFWVPFWTILGTTLTSFFHIFSDVIFDRIFDVLRGDSESTTDIGGVYPPYRGIPSPTSKIEGSDLPRRSLLALLSPSAVVFSRSVFFDGFFDRLFDRFGSQNGAKIDPKSTQKSCQNDKQMIPK